VIDMHPPNNSSSHSKPTKNSSQLTRVRQLTVESQLKKDTAKSQLTKKSQLTRKRQLTKWKSTRRFSSLGVLLNLDLLFMRPKLIFVRLIIISISSSIDKRGHHRRSHEKGKSS
jgi:hypothetical protein